LAVGLVPVAACGSGETLLGERDSAADGDADTSDDVGRPDDVAEVADEASEAEEVGPVCGDGVIDTGEECDLLNLDGVTCVSLGHDAGGTLRCDASCHFDESRCRNPECGNGTCELGETASGCPADCHDGCGDGSCAHAENQFVCPADCGAVAISTGGTQACAVLADGTAVCWELSSRTPTRVGGFWTAFGVSVGWGHSCVLLADRTARCWGTNDLGQLGNGTTTNSDLPVVASGLADIVAISAGPLHSYAVVSDGTAFCWGDCYGSRFLSPTVVPELADLVGISAGRFQSCALLSDGTAQCWGYDTTPPEAVPGLAGAVDVSSGSDYSCAVLSDGTARCWGTGLLGDGMTTTGSDTPVVVSGLRGVNAVSVGVEHACAIPSEGTVWCWGLNDDYGHSGVIVTYGTYSDIPAQVAGLAGVEALSAGGSQLGTPTDVSVVAYSCAVLADGTAWCWGGSDGLVPVQVAAW
jgi:alpha-tubulin suppressor-like RCC1 family protein